MRGEYPVWWRLLVTRLELPPRARRIPGFAAESDGVWGTTSACAENTPENLSSRGRKGNYLRVRGEYGVATTQSGKYLELPPRARRIRAGPPRCRFPLGTTSACAENTGWRQPNPVNIWNYLRVRGEYAQALLDVGFHWELPPRARRIRRPT